MIVIHTIKSLPLFSLFSTSSNLADTKKSVASRSTVKFRVSLIFLVELLFVSFSLNLVSPDKAVPDF